MQKQSSLMRKYDFPGTLLQHVQFILQVIGEDILALGDPNQCAVFGKSAENKPWHTRFDSIGSAYNATV
jgi:hypothetical protein